MKEDIYQSKPYKRTRIAFTFEAVFPYLATLLAGDAFLANLLTEIGLTPSMTGLIASFGSLACIFGLLNLVIAKKIKTSKTVTIITNCLSMLMYMLLYLIPFTNFSKSVKIVLVFVFIICAYLFVQSTSTILFQWGQKFVDPEKRGSFAGFFETVSLVAAFIFTLSMGRIIDMFKNANNMKGGFLFVAISIFVLTVFTFISLMAMEKDDLTSTNGTVGIPFKETFSYLSHNKGYVAFTAMSVIYYISLYMTVGFLGTFKIQEMAISVGTVQVFTNLGILARIFIQKFCGKLADKHSFTFVIKCSFFVQICSMVAIVFAKSSQFWWLILIHSVLYNVSLAGLEGILSNTVFDYVEQKYVSSALSLRALLMGIFAFPAAIAASKILAYIQANNNMIFGIKAYGQQFLAFISIVILVIDILFVNFILEKQKKLNI